MPDRLACVHCRRVGLVRRERVIQGGMTTTEYYCGACEHGWSVRDTNERRLTPRFTKSVPRHGDTAHDDGPGRSR